VATIHSLQGGFFFAQTIQALENTFEALFSFAADSASEKLGKYGTYLLQQALAEAGVFTLPNFTPMESAAKAELWNAFLYLDAQAAIRQVQNKRKK